MIEFNDDDSADDGMIVQEVVDRILTDVFGPLSQERMAAVKARIVADFIADKSGLRVIHLSSLADGLFSGAAPVLEPISPRPLSFDDRRDYYTDGEYSAACAPEPRVCWCGEPVVDEARCEGGHHQ